MKKTGCILFAAALLAGCTAREEPVESFPPLPERPQVEGARAFDEVSRFVGLGPRVAGTDGMEQAVRYLAARLSEYGVKAEIDRFTEKTSYGEVTFRNVIARIPGPRPGLVVLGSHTDTKGGISDDFIGANDSGSSTGLLVELARLLAGETWTGPDLLLAFFDGEECHKKYGPKDGFHGSRRLVDQLREAGELEQVRAAVIIDMIGEEDVHITLPRNCSPELVSLAFDAARAEGERARFKLYNFNVGDDHVPFLQAGVPALNLIDFHFGSAPGLNDYWHTTEDTLDKLSPDSLELIGNITLRIVYDLSEE